MVRSPPLFPVHRTPWRGACGWRAPRIAPRRRDRKAGCAEESLPAYRRAAELDAGNARAHLGLAGALYESGRVEESLPAYRRAAELDAGNARVWIDLAKALAEAGRSKEADEARDKAFGYR